MRNCSKRIAPLLFFVHSLLLNAQAQDSSQLSYHDFLGIVLKTHPLAKQAELLGDESRFQLMMAKGQFDPVLKAAYTNKFYSGKNYYSILQTLAEVPLWFGPDFKFGFDQNEGDFLNNENYTPEKGLLYAGIKVPLAQGLLIDQRRAAVRKAKNFAAFNEQQRRYLLNELFYSAASTYYEWMLRYRNLEVFRKGVELASKRLDFVKALQQAGERTAVDTLEARIQLQSREMDFNEAEMVFKNAGLLLSVFLWNEDGSPMELRELVHPQLPDLMAFSPISRDTLNASLNRFTETHPALVMYQYKLKELDIEKKVKTDQLKPQISAQYNFLSAEKGGNSDLPSFSTENYKWGLQFNFPLFLRQERGSIGLTRVKIEQTRYEQELKQAEIRVNLLMAYNEMQFFSVQMEAARANFTNSVLLLEAERFRFAQGESTLFMINSREVKVIESEVKYNETVAKFLKSFAAYKYALGEGFN